MRDRLGDRYVESLRSHYDGRVPGAADLCCYWFEKAREHLIAGRCRRVGLLATQSIRGGQSRQVLERIVADANIFFAVSDRDWILDGANVHVSMVGFDRGEEKRIELDGVDVTAINPDLTAGVNVTRAHALPMPASEFFQGPVRVGDFDVSHEDAIEWLRRPNPHGRPNSDVLRPTLNGSDNLKRSRDRWVVDFFRMPEEAARLYEGPFEYVRTHVQPTRSSNPRQGRRERWWQHGETGDAMRSALEGCSRMLVVTQTAKHLVFRWQPTIVHPEQTVIVFAREDDYFFGVLHSRVHAIWASAMGTQLEDRPRYTPTTCFETFPFPEVSESDRKAIASVASQLNKLREQWLNPPEWTVTESLIFPASAKGPWGGLVSDADETGVGTARWQRTVAKDEDSLRSLRARTLTNLYNQPPEWLTALHRSLDEAVFTAYGWSSDMPEEEVLDRLLRLNLALTSKVVPA